MRPGTQYEGHVQYSGGETVSVQCAEARCGECPDDLRDEERTDHNGPLMGYHCECLECDHGEES